MDFGASKRAGKEASLVLPKKKKNIRHPQTNRNKREREREIKIEIEIDIGR